jgi:hypothetical protein
MLKVDVIQNTKKTFRSSLYSGFTHNRTIAPWPKRCVTIASHLNLLSLSKEARYFQSWRLAYNYFMSQWCISRMILEQRNRRLTWNENPVCRSLFLVGFQSGPVVENTNEHAGEQGWSCLGKRIRASRIKRFRLTTWHRMMRPLRCLLTFHEASGT